MDSQGRLEETLPQDERGAADPALEEVVVLRGVLDGVVFETAVQPTGIRRPRLYDGLPAPGTSLFEAGPPPVGRLRTRAPGDGQP